MPGQASSPSEGRDSGRRERYVKARRAPEGKPLTAVAMAPGARSCIPARARASRREAGALVLQSREPAAERLRCVRPPVTGWGHGAQTTGLCGKGDGRRVERGSVSFPSGCFSLPSARTGAGTRAPPCPPWAFPPGVFRGAPGPGCPSPTAAVCAHSQGNGTRLSSGGLPLPGSIYTTCESSVGRPCETREPLARGVS